MLKIFFDSHKSEDKQLVEQLKTLNNVYTQALAVEENMPWKGILPLVPLSKNTFGYPEHNSAWVPNSIVAPYFKGVGLVNGKSNEKGQIVGFYLVNSILGQVYPSLPLMLAHAWKGTAITNPKSINSDGSFPLPTIPKPLPWKTYSFIDLIDGSLTW